MSPHTVTSGQPAVREHAVPWRGARRVPRHQPRRPAYFRPRPARQHAAADPGGSEPSPARAPVPGTLTEWHDMTPGEQVTAWAQLREFVTWLADRYELTVEERMPRCWAQHPGLVEELWALRAWRLEIYGGAMPSAGQAARYWHAELERVLHAASARYAAGCRAGHRGAPGLAAVDNDLQETWAASNMLAGVPPADISAGRAKRAGNWISPEEMAAAFDAGDADTVPGLRDYVQYGGTWWVPGGGGWIGVPAPAVPGRAAGTRGGIRDDGSWAR